MSAGFKLLPDGECS